MIYWKIFLKSFGSDFFYKSGIVRIFHRFYQPRRGTILCYHKIAGNVFARQMNYLIKHYQVLSLDDFVSALEANNLPENAVCLTFDDGYKHLETQLLPVIQHFEIPATVFLTTDFLDNKRSAWWENLRVAIFNSPLIKIAFQGKNYPIRTKSQKWQTLKIIQKALKSYSGSEREKKVSELRKILKTPDYYFGIQYPNPFLTSGQINKLVKNGITIGAHTKSHPILSQVDQRTAREEICGSRRILEERFNSAVHFFSYPNGNPDDFSEDTIEILKDSQFKAAVTLIPGKSGPGDNLFRLKRIEIDEFDSLSVFATKLSGIWGLLRGGKF